MRRTWSRQARSLRSAAARPTTRDLPGYGSSPASIRQRRLPGLGFRLAGTTRPSSTRPPSSPARRPHLRAHRDRQRGQESLADIALIPPRDEGVRHRDGDERQAATGGNVAAIRRSDSEMSMALDGCAGDPSAQTAAHLTGMTPDLDAHGTTGGRAWGSGRRTRVRTDVGGVGDEDISSVVLVMGVAVPSRRVTFEGVAPQDISSLRVMSRPLDEWPGMGCSAGRPPTSRRRTFELTGLSGPCLLRDGRPAHGA